MAQYAWLLSATLLSWGGINAVIATFRLRSTGFLERLLLFPIGLVLIVFSWITFRTFL